ncbi:MAG: PD-(D/E)XK nuclease family protein, partial [Myxococcaceae bacterium]
EASGWMMTLSERGAIPVVGWREHAVPDIGAPGKLTERRAAVALVLGAEIGHGAERVAVERARVRQAFGSHVWFNDAMARGEQERERECFFAGNGPPGPASGAVGQSAASDTVLAFPRSAPLTATALGRWANCAFQGFVAHALGVRAESPTDDAPDPRARGILLHRLLELLFRELMKDGTWPPGFEPARVDALIEHALEGALGQLAKTQSLGHPALVGLLKQEARRAARRVLALALEATGTVGGPPSKVGGTPSEVELHFGDERAAPALREVALVQGDEGDVVFVAGAIDRVDEGPEGLFVIDYKTTAPKRARAREALLTTEFQLPLYLYALQQSGRRIHDAAWLSLRDGQLLRLSQLEGVDIHTLVTQELPSTVLSLRRRLREGVWEPASHDCGRCDFSTVCRISADAKKARKESTV